MYKRASLNQKFNGVAAAIFTKHANPLMDLIAAGASKAMSAGQGLNAGAVSALNAAGLPTFNTGVISKALGADPATIKALAGLGLGGSALAGAGLGAAKAAPRINKALAGMSKQQKAGLLAALGAGGAGGAAAMYGDDALAAIKGLMAKSEAASIPGKTMLRDLHALPTSIYDDLGANIRDLTGAKANPFTGR